MKIIEKIASDKPGKERVYYLIDSVLGRFLYYTMAADNHMSATYKNLTQGDKVWRIMALEDFSKLFENPPVETFQSKRLSFPRERISVDCGYNEIYQLAEPRKKDGFLYEIPASELRAFPGTRYPNKEFAYTRYNIAAIRTLERLELERLKTIEAIRFNRGLKHS